ARFELLALADVDGNDPVRNPGLLQEDADLVPVGRRPIIEIDHGFSFPPELGIVGTMAATITRGKSATEARDEPGYDVRRIPGRYRRTHGGDAGGAGFDQTCDAVAVDATQGKYWQRGRIDEASESRNAERRSVGGLAGADEDGAERDVIGLLLRGASQAH